MENASITNIHQQHKPFGFNVIGPVSSNAGLGSSSRAFSQLILSHGFPLTVLDIDPGLDRYKHDLSLERYVVSSMEELPHGINLICLSLHVIPDFVLSSPSVMFRKDCLNVGIVYWELPILPKHWVKTLEFFDVIVAVSGFIRSTLENHLSDVLTIGANYPLTLPKGIKPSRKRFDLPDSVVLFGCGFDPYSDCERKNPFAVLDAFQKAFAGVERAHLVIKLNSTEVDGKPLDAIKILRLRCQKDPRIHLISETLDYVDVLSLYATFDVFVSLHRAEGLGLGPMEAMCLGKPVIATAWSGNMSFMDHTNSCPIGYKLVNTEGSLWVYQKKFLGQDVVWADPNIEEAIFWMRRLAAEPDLRERIGHKGAADMIRYQEDARNARFLQEIQAIWKTRRLIASPGRNKREQLQELRRTVWNQNSTHSQRMVREVRHQLDKHILWRFKKDVL